MADTDKNNEAPMSNKDFTKDDIQKLNDKLVHGEFFTPDHVYIDFALVKDIPLGVVMMNEMKHITTSDQFTALTTKINKIIDGYQRRLWDTVEPFFDELGYKDADIDQAVADPNLHDQIFAMAPTTKFFEAMMRHTIRNQNNSMPAGKFKKKMLDERHFTMETDQITFTINIFPLQISTDLLTVVGQELGEFLGVNIRWIFQDPATFSLADWNSWIKSVDCFYLHDFDRFNRSPTIVEKQSETEFIGKYLFPRKRFPKANRAAITSEAEFDQQIQLITSRYDVLSDFAWLQNNDVRLTEAAEDHPLDLDTTGDVA